jgi:hypothetical protein
LLKKSLSQKGIIETVDMVDFYRVFEPEIKTTTVNWRIFHLIKIGVLNRIGKGKYVFGKVNGFFPAISPDIRSVYTKMKLKFPFLNVCIWSTSFLNEFMNHLPGYFYLLIEVEKDAVDSVFYYLKEEKYFVFIDPAKDLIEKYLAGEKDIAIIKSLVTEAPTLYVQGIYTATLEKILVDIFCDDVIFTAQQGSEMRTIFYEAFNRYTINENRLLRYANRRHRKGELVKYLDSFSNLRQ